jgi:hypothetical protein
MSVPAVPFHWDNTVTSVKGRRLGLTRLSTNLSGSNRGDQEYLVGPAAFREPTSTSETTGTNLNPFGVSYLASGSSSVYVLDPPVPGVRRVIVGSSGGPSIIKTANNEGIFASTLGSSTTVIEIAAAGGVLELIGLTTDKWGAVFGGSTSMFTLTTST